MENVPDLALADDMQAPDGQDRDDYMLQRLPNVELSALPTPLRWFERIVPVDYRFPSVNLLGVDIAQSVL